LTCDSTIWTLKGNFPLYLPFPGPTQKAHIAVIIVRNPIDSIKSVFHYAATNTHNLNVSNDIMAEFKEEWEQCIRDNAKTWRIFYDYWRSAMKS
jgi:hypothetical protein